MCGYRAAGERSIRIDMLERLADMLRSEDSRGGFEAKADMLSITGMTLEQFTDLMTGLGYKAEKGERVKVKAAPAPQPEAAKASGSEDAVADVVTDQAPTTETATPAEAREATVADEPVPVVVATETVPVVVATEPQAAVVEETTPEMEVFITFTWARSRQGGGQRGQRREKNAGDGATRGKPQGKSRSGKPQGGKPQGKGGPGGKKGGRPQQGAKSFSARPPTPEKKIDPDNPFAAALMGMKQGK